MLYRMAVRIVCKQQYVVVNMQTKSKEEKKKKIPHNNISWLAKNKKQENDI